MLICFLLLLNLGITVIAFLIIKKQYANNCILRLDPLESKKLVEISTGKNRQLWILGDSRAEHWNAGFINKLSCEVINRGISAQTSKQVLERFKNDLEVNTPAWIILQVGINDLKIIGLANKLKSQITNDCYNNVTKILELCTKTNIKIICTPVLMPGNIELLRKLVWNADIGLAIADLNERLEKYCLLNGTIFYNVNETLGYNKDRLKKEHQNGFLHLKDHAYKILSAGLIEKYGNVINE